jgi:hypothetical protein
MEHSFREYFNILVVARKFSLTGSLLIQNKHRIKPITHSEHKHFLQNSHVL